MKRMSLTAASPFQSVNDKTTVLIAGTHTNTTWMSVGIAIKDHQQDGCRALVSKVRRCWRCPLVAAAGAAATASSVIRR